MVRPFEVAASMYFLPWGGSGGQDSEIGQWASWLVHVSLYCKGGGAINCVLCGRKLVHDELSGGMVCGSCLADG